MPTSGGTRPGPVSVIDAGAEAVVSPGFRPVAIRIAVIQVDAEVQRAYIVDGVMQDPAGPFVVAWYGQTERVGVPGNAVFSGHVDYAGIGPAIFARVGKLTAGDSIEVVAINGEQYAYAVSWREMFPAATAPVEEILRQTEAEEITLITCGGAFESTTGVYSDRLIVRASRVV
jgi:LPXTG-site transpeptidase (sortase) family protein